MSPIELVVSLVGVALGITVAQIILVSVQIGHLSFEEWREKKRVQRWIAERENE